MHQLQFKAVQNRSATKPQGKPQGGRGLRVGGAPSLRVGGGAPRLLRFISAAPDSWRLVLQIVWGTLSMLSRAIGTAGHGGYG